MTPRSWLAPAALPSLGEPSHLLPVPGGGRDDRLRYEWQVLYEIADAVGRCPDTPTHIISAHDSSGSVTCHAGNDPFGRRFDEHRLALDVVGRKCRCDDELVSVLHFDHPVGNDLIAAKLTDTEAIEAALQTPRDGGGCSLLRNALPAAEALADAYPDHRTIFVVYTDWQLFDSPRLEDRLLNFPGEVHAVVLGGGYTCFDNEQRVASVTKVDRESVPGSIAKTVFGALTAERDASIIETAAPARILRRHAWSRRRSV